MIRNFAEENSILNQFILEIREEVIQKDKMRFRRNMERIGEVMALELSKTLEYEIKEVQTPLGTLNISTIKDEIVLATILRAGLPFHQGFLNYFDQAENAFISSYRKYTADGDFEIKFEYLSSPDITGKQLIIIDPMIASGSSMLIAYKALLERGKPKHTHIVSAIGSKIGLEYMRQNLNPRDVSFWFGAIDPELTSKSYIVPGLGDAGDLAYGGKI